MITLELESLAESRLAAVLITLPPRALRDLRCGLIAERDMCYGSWTRNHNTAGCLLTNAWLAGNRRLLATRWQMGDLLGRRWGLDNATSHTGVVSQLIRAYDKWAAAMEGPRAGDLSDENRLRLITMIETILHEKKAPIECDAAISV